MMVTMPYSLYKAYYSAYPAGEYDPKTKKIFVNIPNPRRKPWPKDWARSGNRLITPGGCEVLFWNTGFAENFDVRMFVPGRDPQPHKIVHPGIDSRERVLAAVQALEETYGRK